MSLIFQWMTTVPSVYNADYDTSKPSIKTDADGNTYVAYINKTPYSGQTNVGLIDICVAKISTSGTIEWIRQQPSFDTSENDVDPSLDIDSSGNIYVTYNTNGSVSGQTGSISSLVIVVFKLNSSGDTLWVKQSTDFNVPKSDISPTIGVDSNGNVYVAYDANDTTQPNEYYEMIIVFKLDTNGNFLWVNTSKTFNTSGGNSLPSIAIDGNSNCFITYMSDGNGQPVSGESNIGSNDVIVFKMDSNGQLLWTRQRKTFDTDNYDNVPKLAVDNSGYCYVAYETYGSVSGQTNIGQGDVVIVKFDPDGKQIWITQSPIFNTVGTESFISIAVNHEGYLFATYQTDHYVSGQTLTGITDIVVIELDNDGNVMNAIQQPNFNTIYNNRYPDISCDYYGNCYVAYYSVYVDNDDTSIGNQNIIVFKLSSTVCVSGTTNILMADGTIKQIQDIQRGDIVAPNHQVARLLCEQVSNISKIDIMIFEKNCLGHFPDENIVITPNHPIIFNNARRPAICFQNCQGVHLFKQVDIKLIENLITDKHNHTCLYDIQFDHEGSYIANGMEIQSRSPYSYFDPLPKNLYFDQSLYNDEHTWDTFDATLPLDKTILSFNVIVRKNKFNHHYGTSYNTNDNYNIIKYL